MKIATARICVLSLIQYLAGHTVGALAVTLDPGYPYAIVGAAMIPVIIFVWLFSEGRLVEHGWIKP